MHGLKHLLAGVIARLRGHLGALSGLLFTGRGEVLALGVLFRPLLSLILEGDGLGCRRTGGLGAHLLDDVLVEGK